MKGKWNLLPIRGASGHLMVIALVLTLLVSALFVVQGSALSNGGYAINWWSVDGGSALLTGGDYVLAGTVGQHDAGYSQNAPFTIASGYWGHIVTIDGQSGENLYLPLVMDESVTTAVIVGAGLTQDSAIYLPLINH